MILGLTHFPQSSEWALRSDKKDGSHTRSFLGKRLRHQFF